MASAKGKKFRSAKRPKKSRANREPVRFIIKKRTKAQEKKRAKKLGYSPSHARRKSDRGTSKQYIQTAKKLSPYVPELRRLSNKKSLTQKEKATVTRYNKSLRHFTGSLHAIPRKDRKKFKGTEFAKGVDAIALNNFSTDATVKAINDDIIIVSNGRTWLLWRLDKKIVRNKKGEFEQVARDAFNAQFPVELVQGLAEEAFKKLKVEAVALWITSGRADRTFGTIGAFVRWLHTRLHAGVYNADKEINDRDAGSFIKGLAILVEQPPTRKSKKKGKRK